METDVPTTSGPAAASSAAVARASPKKRRRTTTTAAPPQVRPSSGNNGIAEEDYTPDVFLAYIDRAFGTDEFLQTELIQHFRQDQNNPFMGFLEDDLKRQKTWILRELKTLVEEGMLHQSIYQCVKTYSINA